MVGKTLQRAFHDFVVRALETLAKQTRDLYIEA